MLAFRARDVLRDGGVDDAEALLGPIVGASAHPDIVDELVRAADGLIPARLPDALRVARLNVALHPRSPRALLSLAELVLLSDDGDAVDQAVLLLERASRPGATGPLSASLWRRRMSWLRRQPLARASVAADVLRAFVLARATSQSDADDDDG